jgi:hypothetical protein
VKVRQGAVEMVQVAPQRLNRMSCGDGDENFHCRMLATANSNHLYSRSVKAAECSRVKAEELCSRLVAMEVCNRVQVEAVCSCRAGDCNR